jgi:hypothetical protein
MTNASRLMGYFIHELNYRCSFFEFHRKFWIKFVK